MTRHQNAAEPQDQSTLYPYLRAYDWEPIGGFLVNRLNLSRWKAAVTAYLVTISLNLGVLWARNHHVRGIPLPQHLIDILRVAPNWDFYYPDLNALLFDILLNPLLMAILVYFCSYAKEKVVASFRNGLIVPRQPPSSLTRLVSNPCFLLGYPLFLSLLTAWNIYLTRYRYLGESPLVRADILFLTSLAMYVRASLLLYAIYTLLILTEQEYQPEFQKSHYDGCGGWAPLRDLRNRLDFVFFFLAIYATATMFTLSFPKNVHLLKDILCIEALVYLFPLFPILLGWSSFQGVYAPYQEMRKLKAYPYGEVHEQRESIESRRTRAELVRHMAALLQEDQESLQGQIQIHKRNLGELEVQRAQYGIDVPPVLWHRIDHENKQIARLEAELEKLTRESSDQSLESTSLEILDQLRERIQALPEWPVKRNLRMKVLLASCIYLAVLALLLIKI